MDNNEKYKHLRAAAHITQFGLNMVTPIVLCTVVAVWLENKFHIGKWVIIVGIISGVAASVLNMFSFIKTVNKSTGGEKDDKGNKN